MPKNKIRGDYREAVACGVDGTVFSDLDNALDYYDGNEDRDRKILEDALIERYATAIKKVQTADGSTIESYSKPDAKNAIQRGRHELVLTRTSKRIANSRGTMFTEADNQFLFLSEDGTRQEEVEELMSEHRGQADFLRTMIRADRVSACLGSCLVYVYWQDGNLKYQAVPPQCVFPLFNETIAVDGTVRAVDTSSISDASAWVLRLNRVRRSTLDQSTLYATNDFTGSALRETSDSQWVAYIGASDRYPHGRCVQFSANDYRQIPEPGSDGIYDFEWQGSVANPLTVLHQQDPDMCPCEYPISIIIGSDTGSDGSMMPVTGLSLFRDALEIDMAWSRLQMSSIKSARGVYIIANEMNAPYPPAIDEGVVALREGQSLSTTGVSASNSKDAAEVLKAAQRTIAEAYNVPGHEVVSDGGTAPESGVAVFLRSQPKIKDRQERIAMNRSSVDRVWHIERSLLALNGIAISPTVEQAWLPGELKLPMTAKESIEETNLALQGGYIDYIEALRKVNGLETIDEATKLYEQLAKRKEEFPPLKSPQQTQEQQQGDPRQQAIDAIRARRGQPRKPQPPEQED